MNLKMGGKTLKLRANAKINLFLQICGKRPDSYHDISTVMQSITLYDEITIIPNDSKTITLSVNGMKCDKNNIIYSAVDAFLEKHGTSIGAEILLDKHIPLSSGMGGGSTDAAAVINGFNILCGEKFSQKELCNIAVSVGADVPFCISGGTALAEGIGEKLTSVRLNKVFDVIIIKCFEKQSTGVMYSRADSFEPSKPKSDKIISLIESNDYVNAFSMCENDFLRVSDDFEAQQKIIDELYENGALLASLSGSGPTIFGLFDTIPHGLDVTLKQKYNGVYLCKTCQNSFDII